jgi:hypothetical protein
LELVWVGGQIVQLDYVILDVPETFPSVGSAGKRISPLSRTECDVFVTVDSFGRIVDHEPMPTLSLHGSWRIDTNQIKQRRSEVN